MFNTFFSVDYKNIFHPFKRLLIRNYRDSFVFRKSQLTQGEFFIFFSVKITNRKKQLFGSKNVGKLNGKAHLE
jgi:hypothetical protein